jgi:putative membrane protein
MRNRNTYAAAFALTGLMTLAPTFAWQNQGATTQGTDTQNQGTASLSAQDRKFVMDAAQGGMAEVELGQLAIERAVNADVKAFARRMVDDHTAANEKLKQVAREKSVTLPTELSAEHKQHRDKLAKATGAEFDKMYMSHMVKDHEKTVADFEKETKNGQDAAVRAFAQQTLPTLNEHLELTHQLATKVGADHGGHSGH